jgi:hypothetical protein
MLIRSACTVAVTSLVLMAATGCASTPARTDSTASTPQAAVRPAQVYVTGSRLPVHVSSTGQASGAQPMQSVGQQEITLSGQTNTADAFKNLVPSQVLSSGSVYSGH